MKRFFVAFTGLLLAIGLCTAQSKYPNHPLPSNPDTLRILAIGNSFSDDATEYLPGLLEAAGIHNVILGRLYIGGCTLERHCKEYETNGHEYVYLKSVNNKWKTIKRYQQGHFMDGLGDEPWDIITMQQGSPKSGRWDSYDPWLGKLIEIVRKECSNPDAAIVWHQTWAYSHTYTNRSFANYAYDQQYMFDSIQLCVDKARKEYGIDIVIPSGPAVQMLRKTWLNTDKDLTRDGFHMSFREGRYATACVWFETLIRPTLGVSVKGNAFRNAGTENEVTDKEAKLMQKIAVKAAGKANSK
ncbi:MAG: DUF4886 domain-containing protein [Bacteroidales bacterium]|nr:DUF4886 domain-containing protein [Bacteroidales bacterium]